MNIEFIDENKYVDKAEEIIEGLCHKRDDRGNIIPLVTTSKIRNILAIAADIYDKMMQSNSDEFGNELASRIEYLRVRMIYEAGRDKSVKAFIYDANLLKYAKTIGNDKKKYQLFYHYLEALIAFHRYKGAKEN